MFGFSPYSEAPFSGNALNNYQLVCSAGSYSLSGAKTPHLVNGNEFDDYRVALRDITLKPPISVTEWPVKPEEQWSV